MGNFLRESHRGLNLTTRLHVARSLRIGWAICLLSLCVFTTCAGTNLHFTWWTRWQNFSCMNHKIRLWNYGCVNSVWSCHYMQQAARPAQPHVHTGSYCSKSVYYVWRLRIGIWIKIFYVSLSLSVNFMNVNNSPSWRTECKSRSINLFVTSGSHFERLPFRTPTLEIPLLVGRSGIDPRWCHLGFFPWFLPTKPRAMRSTQPLKMSTRDFSWGKGCRRVWLTAYHPCSAESREDPGP